MKPLMTTTGMLLRRELWEHKTAVIWTPVVIAVALAIVLILASIFAATNYGTEFFQQLDGSAETAVVENDDTDQDTVVLDFSAGEIVISNADVARMGRWREVEPGLAYRVALYEIAFGFRFLAFIVAVFYLLGALWSDRKDRSILFWKSLPFGESHGIATKLVTAAFVMPLIALAAAMLVQIVAMVLMTLFFTLAGPFSIGEILGQVGFIQIFFTQLGLLLTTGLKLLPLFSLLLLGSAAATRSPLGLIVVPPLVAIAVEFFIFNTTYVARTLGYLFFGDLVFFGDTFDETGNLTRGIRSMLIITPWQLLKIVLVSAPLLYATVWFRNNRYEI